MSVSLDIGLVGLQENHIVDRDWILCCMLHGWVCYFFNRLILADGHVKNYNYHIFLDHAAFKIISLGFETLLSTEFRTIDLCTYVLVSPLVV